MRPYRAIPIDGKDFVYGWYVEIDENPCIVEKDCYSSTYRYEAAVSCENFIAVIPETVGQQVGLKDKNGVEIYEGDIVRFTTNNGKDFKTAAIEFQEHCYHAGFFPDKSTNAACWWEIIGHIHSKEQA